MTIYQTPWSIHFHYQHINSLIFFSPLWPNSRQIKYSYGLLIFLRSNNVNSFNSGLLTIHERYFICWESINSITKCRRQLFLLRRRDSFWICHIHFNIQCPCSTMYTSFDSQIALFILNSNFNFKFSLVLFPSLDWTLTDLIIITTKLTSIEI